MKQSICGHGDIREITDTSPEDGQPLAETGNTLVKYSYDAWGNPTTVTIPPSLRGSTSTSLSTGSATEAISRQLIETNPYRYASYRYDSETGLYYLRARYYDPITGRFLSSRIDGHLVKDRSVNVYPYVRNNPVNAKDPSGSDLYLSIDDPVCFRGTTPIDICGKAWFWTCKIYSGSILGGKVKCRIRSVSPARNIKCYISWPNCFVTKW